MTVRYPSGATGDVPDLWRWPGRLMVGCAVAGCPPATMVRVPGASHNLVDRPSQLISKVAHVLQWFSDHRENATPRNQ